MRPSHRSPLGEVWMVLTDKNRKRLLRLMVIQDVSQRELAKAAGWESHSYMGRLMRGEVATLKNDAAVRIAHYMSVGTDDLFLSRSSSAIAHTAPRRRTVAA